MLDWLRHREYPILLASLVKWLTLGALVGVASGSASALFLWSLEIVTRTRETYTVIIWLLPLAGLLIGWVYRRYGKLAAGGNNLILSDLHLGEDTVPLRMAPLILGGTLLTHLFGGSAGREGTAVQMGGSLAAWFGRLLRLSPEEKRLLLTSGIAGGFGSIFGTPLAGTVFALEMPQVGGARYRGLIGATSAAFVGDLVTRAWGIGHAHYPLLAVQNLAATTLGKVLLLGVACGLVSRLFAELTHTITASFRRAVPWEPLRPAIGGLMLVVIIFGLHAFDYVGLGAPMISRAFTPGGVPTFAFLWKLLLTALTLGAGFKGGEVTPLFFIGATLGSVLAPVLGLPVPLAAAAGFVGVFAGAANTPIACLLMGAELFGSGGLVYIGLTCIIAYFISGHGGIYSAQRVMHTKS
jgi:H+/Cl- antiporter ClcA